MTTVLKIGVLGLRRGAHLARQVAADERVRLVAGCDADDDTRAAFARAFPDAEVCREYEELVQSDIDAVIVASGCHQHGPDAVRALRAGKHVFSEVTAFHTLADGVALVRAVEETGLLYMLGENVCYFPTFEEAARIFRSGRLGQFMYAECEYVHDCRRLMHNRDGARNWRSYLAPLYYCTHSLGPIFQITGDRPVRVVGMDTGAKVDPAVADIDMEAALIKMASGAVVRLLCGLSLKRNPQSLWFNLFGTKGMVESSRWPPTTALHVYEEDSELTSQHVSYEPRKRGEAKEAARAGHGGADFYTVRDFLDALIQGKPSPIDVYAAADMTLPGILGHFSAAEGGLPLDIPDLRDHSVRSQYENDTRRTVPEGV